MQISECIVDGATETPYIVPEGDPEYVYFGTQTNTTVTAKQVSDGRDRLYTNLPPRTVGTSASPLMDKLDGGHYEVRLSRREKDVIR